MKNKILQFTIMLGLLTITPRVNAYNASDLVTEYGTNGIVVDGTVIDIADMTFDSSGRIVLVGSKSNTLNSDIVLARLTTNGALDTSFGTDGIVTLDTGIGSALEDTGTRVAMDNSDPLSEKIVVLGNVVNDTNIIYYTYDTVLARYLSDGSLDTNFGTSGVAVDQREYSQIPTNLGVTKDGTIYISGYTYDLSGKTQEDFFVQSYSNGSFSSLHTYDTGFGFSDIMTTLLSDGASSVYLIGKSTDGSSNQISIMKIDTNTFALDNSFGSSNGIQLYGINSEGNVIDAAFIDSKASIVIAITYDNSNKIDLYKFDTSGGNIDNNYGTYLPGAFEIGTTGSITQLSKIIVQSDDTLFLSGTNDSSGSNDFFLSKFNSSGSFDTNFGSDGIIFVGNAVKEANALLQDSDGHIFIGGTSENTEKEIMVAKFFGTATCGDKLVKGTESCDDGNLTSHDGCDEHCGSETQYFQDNDGDGYGATLIYVYEMSQPSGYTNISGDCDDSHSGAFPGGSEVCGNTIDEDCDLIVKSCDTDGDGIADENDNCPNFANTNLADTDGDSAGDVCDAFPNDATETLDMDGDGVGDNMDAFPNDPTETKDENNNGIGDNADEESSENSSSNSSSSSGASSSSDSSTGSSSDSTSGSTTSETTDSPDGTDTSNDSNGSADNTDSTDSTDTPEAALDKSSSGCSLTMNQQNSQPATLILLMIGFTTFVILRRGKLPSFSLYQ